MTERKPTPRATVRGSLPRSDEPANKRLPVRLTPAELAQVHAQAAANDQTVSEYVRARLKLA